MFRSSFLAPLSASFVIAVLCCPASQAAEPLELQLTLKSHLFDPPELKAKAGQPIVITVTNEDDTPEEFESETLRLEKIVAPKSSIKLRVKSLSPAQYEFHGEYNESAKGTLIVE
jgi:hypothetical protein